MATEAQPDLKSRTALLSVGRYGFAVVCVAVAVGLGHLMPDSLGIVRPFFSIAIVVVTWYAGVGPSVLAVLLSVVCYDYFFTPPLYVLNLTSENLPHLLVFAGWS